MDYIEHGLAVLALIMYFFNGHKKLGTYSEKLFNAYLVVNMLYLFWMQHCFYVLKKHLIQIFYAGYIQQHLLY